MGQARIFISVVAHREPLLFFTLNSAVAQASQPALLSFGVVDQNTVSQRASITLLPYAKQIRYVYIPTEDTLGVCWARSIAFSLYDGENYLLQIDAHTLFEPGWDDTLRRLHTALLISSAKPIVTTRPFAFEMRHGEPVFPTVSDTLVVTPRPNEQPTPDKVILHFENQSRESTQPITGCHIAAAFLFTHGTFVEEIPYDPYLYFSGEEFNLSVRAFTHGWDIFHPPRPPLYHAYRQAGTSSVSLHWQPLKEGQRDSPWGYLAEREKRRITRLLRGEGLPAPYGLGKARTLEAYCQISGIDYQLLRQIPPAERNLP
ncbi:MAG: hypothetical protein LBK01_05425 [Burkholderiaceae bacterium]|nr:hypothetical protein [Burkholderiaceae bacterium]